MDDIELEEAREFLRQTFNLVIRKNPQQDREKAQQFIKLSISKLEEKMQTSTIVGEEKQLKIYRNALTIFEEEYDKYMEALNAKERKNKELETSRNAMLESSKKLSKLTAQMKAKIQTDTEHLQARGKSPFSKEEPNKPKQIDVLPINKWKKEREEGR